MPDEGFTLPEILIAMAVFLLVLIGIISANLFGLKMFQITNTKLNVITWSRETSDKMTAEVHACNSVWVGNVTTNGVFEGLLDGETQQGTGLLIYPTTNTTNYIIYFVNPSDQTFRRTTGQPGHRRDSGRFGHQHHGVCGARFFGKCADQQREQPGDSPHP